MELHLHLHLDKVPDNLAELIAGITHVEPVSERPKPATGRGSNPNSQANLQHGNRFSPCDRCGVKKPPRWMKDVVGNTSTTCLQCNRSAETPSTVSTPPAVQPILNGISSGRFVDCTECRRVVDTTKEPCVGGICITCTHLDLREAAWRFHRVKQREAAIDCRPVDDAEKERA